MSVEQSMVAEPVPAIREARETCHVRAIESPAGRELYITARPEVGRARASVRESAAAMYQGIARTLREAGAAIVQERLFAAADAMAEALTARAHAYGDLDDGVPPTLLVARGSEAPIAGAQVHAISGIAPPRVLARDRTPLARTFECGGLHYLTASALRGPWRDPRPAQAWAAFELAEGLLTDAGGALGDIARTWIWMDDILAWYGELNRVRNEFFTQRGLMAAPGQMPASTGIGVAPASGAVSLDVFAVWGGDDAVARFHAAGNQRSAYEYGSAFARAARARTPGGSTIFCSGTAAIDARGNTCFSGNIPAQVRMTLDNVRAVLRDMGCGSGDVVQAMAYCATPAVRRWFQDHEECKLPWPCLTLIGDVCRPDLLFEVEVTAARNGRR